MSLYRVTGPLRYREHNPGETFEATLDPDVEERAIRHGTIELLERREVTVDADLATAPATWPTIERG